MCLQLMIHVISQAGAIAEVAASRPQHIMWQLEAVQWLPASVLIV